MKIFIAFLLCLSTSVFAQAQPAYSVAEITIIDKEGYEKNLLPKIQELVSAAGGIFIVEGGQSEEISGVPKLAGRIVIVKFKSYLQAKDFYASQPYQQLKPMVDKYIKIRLYIVEGSSL